MSLTNFAEGAFLDLLFINANWANVGDSTGLMGSTANGNLYVSLHTADPGEAGSQLTNEVSYTSYARASIARGPATFTRSVSTIVNASTVSFPQATGGSAAVTHFGIGTQSSGAGDLLMKGALSATLNVSTGIAPEFAPGALTASVD